LTDSPPVEALGNIRGGYIGYAVAVAVGYPDAADQATLGIGGTDAKRITVTVTPPGRAASSFQPTRRTSDAGSRE
jgi:hypothetical protein